MGVVSMVLAAFAVFLCVVVDVTITAEWVRVLPLSAAARPCLSHEDILFCQVQRWFTSDNTFLRPLLISFVGAVAVLLPVPLTVSFGCFARVSFSQVITAFLHFLHSALPRRPTKTRRREVSHLAALPWRCSVCGAPSCSLGHLLSVGHPRRLLPLLGSAQGKQ